MPSLLETALIELVNGSGLRSKIEKTRRIPFYIVQSLHGVKRIDKVPVVEEVSQV